MESEIPKKQNMKKKGRAGSQHLLVLVTAPQLTQVNLEMCHVMVVRVL